MDDFAGNSILVLDDEDDFRESIVRKVKKLSCTIYEGTNGIIGLKLLTEHKIDLALVDINMPEMNGFQFLEEAKKIAPSMKCVIMTAYGDGENIKKALRLGALDFIEKPVDREELLKCIRTGFGMTNYEEVKDELLEMLLYKYNEISPESFNSLTVEEKAKILKGVSGLMRIKLMNIRSAKHG